MSALSLSAGRRQRVTLAQLRAGRLELVALLALAGAVNLWNLSVNGWANTYYSAAVRSMAASWHDFLFASLDRSGLMTVDKPPLSLWVQATAARIFGMHPLSLLIPQALMGVAAVGLLYDLVRRVFGRPAGLVAGLVLALTPAVVGVSRHNNPDELMLLCSVAALWAFGRALEDGRTRWLVLAGGCVGLGFETKMGVALFTVPGIAIAWIWVRVLGWPGRRAKLRSFAQLLWGGAAMVMVGAAWPVLVMLTPASDRPWISGTSDNSIWSLIFGYNGLGRVAGQTGGPGAGGGPGAAGGPGGSLFGGATGPFRLLQSGLGDQAGWLLGFALVSGLGLVVLTRLRRSDARTGWLIAVGGAFACTAVVFSFASGIFHPYYVSLLAPLGAALVGAGGREALRVRWLGPAAILGGALSELVVLGNLSGGGLRWATPLLVAGTLAGAGGLALLASPRLRIAALGVAFAALLAAPAVWALDTLGHPESSTFPAGGLAARRGTFGPPPGAARFGFAGRFGIAPPGGAGVPPPGGGFGAPPPVGGGGPFGDASTSLSARIAYARAHGGGTVAVESQSAAAAAILASGAPVAGLGGFSGRESAVSQSWLAHEVGAANLRWVITSDSAASRPTGDTRSGSTRAFSAVAKACTAHAVGSTTIYDCAGRAAALGAAR